jgi:pimeloyl-ACP methyl ester carboxylesterase
MGGEVLEIERRMIIGSDGTLIGTATAGAGPALLLVHGGMTSAARWEHLWEPLCRHHRVTVMDRRGRGSSGDTPDYRIDKEYDDVAAVADDLADQQNAPIDAFGHSYGAVCVLGAAARGAEFRRLALYEPPGRETVPPDWVLRAKAMIRNGQAGRAMQSFLIEVIGLTPDQVTALKNAPTTEDILGIVAATLPREADALANVDLSDLARTVTQPVLLMLGSNSPPWAATITRALEQALTDAEVVSLDGHGHEAVDTAPQLVSSELHGFLLRSAPSG